VPVLPLKEPIEKATGRPVYIDNDATLAAYAEGLLAEDRLEGVVVVLTLGTGVGGGIMDRGQLFRGAAGGAGELGHIIVSPGGRRCPCGRKGCLESYASGTAVLLRAQALHEERAKGYPVYENTRQVARAAEAGDQLALLAFSEAAEALATAVASIVSVIDPSVVVMSGGMAATWHLIEPTFTTALLALSQNGPPPIVTVAESAGDSGSLGAALCAAANRESGPGVNHSIPGTPASGGTEWPRPLIVR
jgi:glucokinase